MLMGARKLWHADETIVTPTAEQPFGPPVPARCLFAIVRQRFGEPSLKLGLSPTERRVARSFYLEEQTADTVARLLGMRPGTVP